MADTNKIQGPADAMSLGDHLEELRGRLILAVAGLIVAMVICMCFGTYLVKIIQMPYIKTSGKPLIALAPSDTFISYMKISCIVGLIISSPWVFYHLWAFAASGLYEKERRYVHIAVPFCVILFVTGALFFFFVIAPLSLNFLLYFGTCIGIENSWTFESYISFMTTMMLVFGLSFETPVVIFFLNKIGLVSIEALCKARKFVLLGAFIVGAAATPGPDVFSQTTMALPLYALYELGILICRFSRKKKEQLPA
jgi:sec-independent protein translocase protein TatC